MDSFIGRQNSETEEKTNGFHNGHDTVKTWIASVVTHKRGNSAFNWVKKTLKIYCNQSDWLWFCNVCKISNIFRYKKIWYECQQHNSLFKSQYVKEMCSFKFSQNIML